MSYETRQDKTPKRDGEPHTLTPKLMRVATSPAPTAGRTHALTSNSARSMSRSGRATTTTTTATRAFSPAFADNASGEFEGHHISVDPVSGDVSTLPAHYVPDAFREWGVEILDWQSQCSTTLRPDEGLYVRDARFVPVVGCEADASTVESFERDVIAEDKMTTNDDGWYSAEYVDSKSIEIATHCVTVDDGDQKLRVRLKHRVDNCGPARVWRETYYEPFGDGVSLASACGQCAASAKFGEYPKTTDATLRIRDAAFVAPSNAVYLAVGIWFAITVDDDASGAYTSALGYVNEKANVHCVSRRSRDANGVVDASFERRPLSAA